MLRIERNWENARRSGLREAAGRHVPRPACWAVSAEAAGDLCYRVACSDHRLDNGKVHCAENLPGVGEQLSRDGADQAPRPRQSRALNTWLKVRLSPMTRRRFPPPWQVVNPEARPDIWRGYSQSRRPGSRSRAWARRRVPPLLMLSRAHCCHCRLHKAQLASDRMSCHSATANQVRLVLHTAAFWLMHGLQRALEPCHHIASSRRSESA
jgi:hypothetical protein